MAWAYVATIIGAGLFLICGPRLSPAGLMIFLISLALGWSAFVIYMAG